MKAAYHSLQVIAERGRTHPYYQNNFQNKDDANLFSQYPILDKKKLYEALEDSRRNNPEFYKSVYVSPSGGTTSSPLFFVTDLEENLFQRKEFAKLIQAFDIFNSSTVALLFHGIQNGYRSGELLTWFVEEAKGTAFPVGHTCLDERALGLFQATQPNTVVATPSRLIQFAQYVRNNGHKICIPKLVITSEILLPNQATFLIEALGVQSIVGIFGSAEAGIWGVGPSFLPLNTFIYDSAMIYIETIPEEKEKEEQKDTEFGKLILTNLIRYKNPLIRYECGDSGKVEDYQVPQHINEKIMNIYGYHKILKKMTFKGRSGASFFYRGQYLTFYNVEKCFGGRVLEYQVVLSRHSEEDLTEKAEVRVVPQDIGQMEDIRKETQLYFELGCEVICCTMDQLERGITSQKVIRLIDRR